MYLRKKKIRLYETDATGVLYFAQQLKLAQETFEIFLESASFPLGVLLEKGEVLLPIVHAEADFFQPLRVGDEVELRLSLEKMGRTSFTLGCSFYKEEVLVGTTSIVHVVIEKAAWSSIQIPAALHQCLQTLQIG